MKHDNRKASLIRLSLLPLALLTLVALFFVLSARATAPTTDGVEPVGLARPSIAAPRIRGRIRSPDRRYAARLQVALTHAVRAWSHCSSGNEVRDPDAIRGLFVAGANQTSQSIRAAVLRYLPTDPTICGANLVIPWSAIDNGPGHNPRYNWSFLDKAAAPWGATGKIVNLIVWGVDELTSQEIAKIPATPKYVLSDTPTVDCGAKYGTEIPVYWEPGYEGPWREFEAALVAHVAGNPNIGYIRFGLGAGGEDYPITGFEEGICSERWSTKGLTAAQWLKWSISQIKYEASLGSEHPFNVGLNSFPNAPKLPGQVAAEAAKFGIGFGIQDMTAAQTNLAEFHSERCYADWCRLFKSWAGRVPLEIQTLEPSGPAGGKNTGWLPSQLSYVVTHTYAQVLELYPQEWLVADDPTWPTFAVDHDAYARALANAASEVGGQVATRRNVHR